MDEAAIEPFQGHIEKIKESNILIIIEGKNGFAALNKFGITNIMEITKKPLFQIVEEAANSNKE